MLYFCGRKRKGQYYLTINYLKFKKDELVYFAAV